MSNYFSKNLKYLRETRKMSQNKLAQLSNINHSSINRWEKEEISPALDNVDIIAKVLNVSTADIVGRDLTKENLNSELDLMIFNKAKELSSEDKQVIIDVIDSIRKKNQK